MPVAKHTFHGGEEPGDVAANEPWWHADDVALQRHVSEMARYFPSFSYVPPTKDLAPTWIGTINTGRGSFRIAIVVRRDRGLPTVVPLGKVKFGRSVKGRWTPSPHLFTSGNLCVADRADWDPETHTAATATGWAAHWLAAYTEWRLTGRGWPVEGVARSAS